MLFLVNLFPLILAWTLVHCNNIGEKLFFLHASPDGGNITLLVMTWTENDDEILPGCEYFTDRDIIDEVLLSPKDSPIRTLSEDEMQSLLGDCREFNLSRRKREVNETMGRALLLDDDDDIKDDVDIEEDVDEWTRRYSRRRGPRRQTGNRRSKPERRLNSTRTTTIAITTESPTTLGYDGLPILFPGTKWCGAGAVAHNFSDLGRYGDTDSCCRAHDLCNDTLAPGETRNNLTNESRFTKLCCRCDDEFYNCLQNANSLAANAIGNMYFNILKRECYAVDHPFTKTCKNHLTLLKITCLEYERNTTAPKILQWIKPKRYTRS